MTRRARHALFFHILVSLAAIPFAERAWAGRGNPRIIPPNVRYRGLTYGEWGAEWWRAMFAIPVAGGEHPLLNWGAFEGDRGEEFLTAVGGGAEIDVTVGPGTPILFPVVIVECSVLEPDPFHGDDEEEVRACANGHMDTATGLRTRV